MNLRPLQDRIIVKRVEEETKTAGGLFIPETAKEKPQRGEIVAVGQGKLLDDGKRARMSVKVGDQVVYGKYSGNEIKLDGNELVVRGSHRRLADAIGFMEKRKLGEVPSFVNDWRARRDSNPLPLGS